jgi:endonuclease/exonuclease/phosphatase family metal-dependent hydrolase
VPELRVATFNLLHGRSVHDGVAEPERLRAAAELLDADVVGLQEVDHAQPRSGEVRQTALVADALGAPQWRFVPSVHGTPGPTVDWTPASEDDGAALTGPAYGVGLVSRLPVRLWRVTRFPAARLRLPLLVPTEEGRPRLMRIPDEPRVAVAAVLEAPGGLLTVATAHLSFVPGVNVRQLRALVHWLADLPRPLLVVGDLNLPGSVPRRVTGWTPLAVAATYPSWRPRVQFDHVLAEGVPPDRVRGAHVLPLPVSDHCALAVDLDLDELLGPRGEADPGYPRRPGGA